MKARRKILVAAIGIALADTVFAAVCPVGTFSGDGQDPCLLCAPGTFQELTGQTSCTQTSPGFFVSNAGASAQLSCSAGSYQPLAGQLSCDISPPGSFVSTTGQSEAIACPVGQYQPNQGSTSCFPASLGAFVATTGAISEISCSIGTYQDQPGSSSCNLASPGFFTNNIGATSASSCPPGSFQPLAGQSSCGLSPPGTFVSTAGQSVATDCPVGRFQPNPGSSNCFPADLGAFVAITGATSQTSCSIGAYQDELASTSCKLASPGFFTNNIGATSASSCPPGSFQPLAGQSSCGLSPPGTFVSTAGQSASTACSIGSYQPNAGSSSCLTASLGYFVAGTGATEQTSCSIGSYQGLAGSSSCNLADPGYFVSTVGATAQVVAPVGFFTSTAGTSSAQLCPPGSVSFGASIACRAAPTTGLDIVSPVFNSNLGRGGTFTLETLIQLPAIETFNFNLRNDASAVGVADPLTRLSLNAIADTSPEGVITLPDFIPGTTLDEGADIDIELELKPARLGYVSLGLNVDTDEAADLGDPGLQFEFEFKTHADGGDVAASILADRPTLAGGDTIIVWIDASNPGNTAGTNNQLGLLLPLNTSCNWTAIAEKGAVGDASNLSIVASDIVSLPARSRVLYRGRCATTPALVNPMALSTSILPDITIADLFPADDSTATTVAVVAPEPIMSSAELSLSVLSRTDFLQPDSLQTVVYELVNNGPGAVVNGNFSILTFGASEFIELECSDQPGLNCGQVRQAGDQYRAVDTAVNLAENESVQITLSLRTRTLEAQQLKVIAVASLPPGGATTDFPDDEVIITTVGGLFNNSFE